MQTNQTLSLYDRVCLKCSKITTKSYSTSFSLGIGLLHRKYHAGIYAIYGFVRFADEIVDTFHHSDKRTHLAKFKQETHQAIKNGLSLNPILHSFQWVVNKYGIETELIDTFLHSMEMDLDIQSYATQSDYETYILGSAEVVGLMCLRVFCQGNDAQYQQLKYAAMRLGSAFQKINFLRDLNADYHQLGRVYFPNVQIETFNSDIKRSIELDIEQDFKDGYQGIKQLPDGVKLGVYLAYVYYVALFNKIKALEPSVILSERVRINNIRKYGLIFSSMLKYRIGAI